METISFINFRGGCGKSSNVQNLAAILAKEYGKKVLVLDLDPQMNTTFTFKGDPDKATILNVLNGETDIDEAIQEIEYGYLVQSTDDLFAAEQLINGEEREYRLKDVLDKVADQFDYCLIDTAPGLSILTINAMIASNSIIIPLIPDGYSIQGMGKLSAVIQDIQKDWNQELKIDGLLLNRVERGNLVKDVQEFANQWAADLGTKLYQTPIRKTIRVSDAQLSQKAMIDFDPRSHATEDYRSFAEEFIKDREGARHE